MPIRTTVSNIWWCHPAIAFGVPVLAVALATLATPADAYLTLWKCAKYFDIHAFQTILGSVACFVIGVTIGGIERPFYKPHTDPIHGIRWDRVNTIFNLSVALSFIGYIAWGVVAIQHGLSLEIIADALTGQAKASAELKEQYLTTVPGLTTLTQFGIAAAVLGVPLGFIRGWKTIRLRLGLVLCFGAARAVLHSERLALIELVLPILVSVVSLFPYQHHSKSRAKRVVDAFPPAIMPAFVLLFGAFEYVRSWKGFYSAHEENFARFVTIRLLGYYSTALNNGALILHSMARPFGVPVYTFAFAWKCPLLHRVTEIVLSSASWPERDHQWLLRAAANPEFNNPGGILLPHADFGTLGGLLYWLICGMLCGYAYRQFLRGRAVGLFLYPALFTALLEATRILYWAESRFCPVAVLLLSSIPFVSPGRIEKDHSGKAA